MPDLPHNIELQIEVAFNMELSPCCYVIKVQLFSDEVYYILLQK